MRRILTSTLAGLAVAAVAVAPAYGYAANPDGTFTVTNAELQTAFGSGVDLAKVTFTVEGAHTWMKVPCKKSVGKNDKKSMTKDFTRQTHTEGAANATPTTGGFTLTVAGTTTVSNLGCPKGWSANGAPSPLAKSQAVHVIATSQGLPVELARQ